jgi:hypothetical protein
MMILFDTTLAQTFTVIATCTKKCATIKNVNLKKKSNFWPKAMRKAQMESRPIENIKFLIRLTSIRGKKKKS